MKEQIEWHDKLAEMSLKPSDPETAGKHLAEATRLETEATANYTRVLDAQRGNVREFVVPEAQQAKGERRLAIAAMVDNDAETFLKHKLVAVQLAAVKDKADPTVAVSRVLDYLSEHDDERVRAAVEAYRATQPQNEEATQEAAQEEGEKVED